MAEILDGLKLANKIKRELKERIAREGISAALAVVLVGSDPASEIYVRGKIADCEEVGIKSELVRFGADASEDELTRKIAELNEDKSITGIL
ncbi:MAG: bifunctional methylenetetrahydrofolate dehydrogenase/methenyltetrahydrofolate cyclohydrolase, partial [Oscillospiraceae bacterium]|nr:bifunctional methylenetetrahydrofolate dehydrogenase/methenyltetrahydrofolate cyclohydrolase [Oscillospiraceae bacterium]